MKSVTFPYQQGDLDWLCSIYATINLLHLQEHISKEKDAWVAMRALISYTASTGDLKLAFTKGVEKDDVCHFLMDRGYSSKNTELPSPHEIEEGATDGAVIYIKFDKSDFDHFTVIRTTRGINDVELFDSYGFREIACHNGSWFLDGNPIKILNLYTIYD